MSRENVEVVRKSFEAFSVGGVEAVIPFYLPDVVWYMTDRWIEDSVYRGHDGIRRLTAVFTDNFDDYAWEVHEIPDAQSGVVVLAEMIGRIKNSGSPVREPLGLVVSDFHDGKVGQVRAFPTWQVTLAAVGLRE
jgi:ketosteroid isomerase-like protein